MFEGSLRRYASAWLEVYHLSEQVLCIVIKVLAHLANVLGHVNLPLWESDLHVWKFAKILPSLLSRGPKGSEDLKDLSDFRVTCYQWLLVSNFIKDGSN